MPECSGLILVTGSSGFIGSAVVARLAKRFLVIGCDLHPPPHLPGDAEFLEVDLSSPISIQNAVWNINDRHGPRVASVVHLAAYYDFAGEPSPLYDEITVRGTQLLLCSLQQLEVEQFIFSSTMLVHRPCEPGQRINEDSPVEAKWDYPLSKVRTERLIREERGEIPVLLLRIAGIYDDQCHSIPLAHQMQRIYERHMTSTVYPGDASRGQAFLHLDDLVDAIEAAIDRRQSLPPELTLLLGEPETLSYDELQRTFGRLIHNEEWPTRKIPKALAKAGAWVQDALPTGEEPFIKPWMIDLADDHYALDISRAQSMLGWSPRHSLRQTLPRMVAALQADREAWYRENKLAQPAEHAAAR